MTRQLNILYVGTLPPHPGGSAIVGGQLLEGFTRRGHAVRALAPVTPATRSRAAAFDAAHREIAITRFAIPHFEIPPCFPYPPEYVESERASVEGGLTALIAQDRPDAIIIGRETYARYVPDLAHASRLPCLLVIHGGITHGIIDGTHSPDLARQLLTSYRLADLVVTPGEHMAAGLRRLGIAVSVIPNPVDLQRFSPAQDGAPLRSTLAGVNDVVAMWLGHLRPLKRPLDFVLAAQAALPRDPRLIFVVVGDGPRKSAMAEACREAGVAGRFRFIDWIEHADIPAYLNAADIVVTTTQIENQALIYLETQACARVLLATDIPAAREVVVDGETGLLFPVGNVAECASKLLLAAADPELRRTIGRKARTAVARSHAQEATVAAYEEAIQGLVGRHAPVAGRPGKPPAKDALAPSRRIFKACP
jgi:glycosyltransferase involved in cell wall biosynthesis